VDNKLIKYLHRYFKVIALLLVINCLSPVYGGEATYPNNEWEVRQPEELGLQGDKVKKLMDLSFLDNSTQAAVIIKDGFLVAERYAETYNTKSFGTSWSMAKSFYAALIGISIDLGEIDSLDDKVSKYLDYYNDERENITIRQILNMTSGLEFPENEHESMFFRYDQAKYAREVSLEKQPEQLFEYNNVNSMIIGEILKSVTGKNADILLEERIFDKIGIDEYTLWRDEAGNAMTYCCIDMSPRDYSRFGLLFSRGGKWNNEQVISNDFVNETFTSYWDETPGWWTNEKRGYSLHWWISKNDDEGIIFNASGKFGQYIFVDYQNDIIFTRITKYHPMPGSIQNWGFLKYIDVDNVDLWITILRGLHGIGLIDLTSDITTPNTYEDGESKEFYENYGAIMDAIADLSNE
jgi:CubicO group peptidase (beta-lactamase class C family)